MIKGRVLENITEEEEPQQLLWRENRKVGSGEGKPYVKTEKNGFTPSE